jgi:hypothetical protein
LIEAFEDRFVEFGVGASGKETVQFDEEEEVHVLGGGGLAVAFADMVALRQVDTLELARRSRMGDHCWWYWWRTFGSDLGDVQWKSKSQSEPLSVTLLNFPHPRD